MPIRIKRSTTTATPTSLVEGQLAYSETSENLFVGTSGATIQHIGGKSIVDKVNGIEAGAQANTVDSVAGATGAVTADTILAGSTIQKLSNVQDAVWADGQFIAWNQANSRFEPVAPSGGVSTFVSLNDTPVTYTANYWTKVNATGDGLEFVQDIDDGTF